MEKRKSVRGPLKSGSTRDLLKVSTKRKSVRVGNLGFSELRKVATLEAIESKCIFEKSPQLADFRLNEWAPFLTESIILALSRKYAYFALYVEEKAVLTVELCATIGKVLGVNLIAFSVEGSNGYLWKDHILPMIVNAVNIEYIRLVKVDWINDNITNQMCSKWGKTLIQFDLENLNSIGDNTMFHIGQKALNLEVLNLECCPKITDVGLKEIAKRLHLNSIRITHNLKISDESVVPLLGSVKKLRSLSLANCSNLTDVSVGALYEAAAAWGTKRNTATIPLTSLDLRDNPNFTFGAMNYLCTANPNLQELDLRECTGIDLNKGFQAFEGLNYVSSLRFGPTYLDVDSEELLQSLLFHVARLRVLHIVGIPQLCDTELEELVTNSVHIEELYLSDMEFGERTIEAVCNQLPDLKSISLIGSSLLSDMHIRALMIVCRKLTSITLQRCPNLTDAAFTKTNFLQDLTRLDISQLSKHCTGLLLGSLADCPLEYLNLDGLNFKPSVQMVQLTGKTKSSVKELYVRDNLRLDKNDCLFMVSNFLNCRMIDISGCSLSTAAVSSMWHPNPFLSFASDISFFGFKHTLATGGEYDRFKGLQLRYRMHYAVRLLQRARRRQKEYRVLQIQRAKTSQEAYKVFLIVKIQSIMRMCIAKRKTRFALNAATTINCACKWHLLCIRIEKMIRAKEHYRQHLLRYLFILLQKANTISHDRNVAKSQALQPKLALRLQRKTFMFMQHLRKDKIEHEYVESVLVLWEIWLLRRVINGWKTLRGVTRNRATRLLAVFNLCISLNVYNSRRQIALVKAADHFSMRRVMLPAWACLCDDFLRARMAEKLMPVAIKHAEKGFFNRVIRNTFGGFVTNKKNRYFKRQAKLKGERHRQLFLRSQFFKRCDHANIMRQAQLALIALAVSHALKVVKSGVLRNGRRYACQRKYFYLAYQDAIRHHLAYGMRNALQLSCNYVMRRKTWRAMNTCAVQHRTNKLLTRNFGDWKMFWDIERNLIVRLRERYHTRLMKRVFHRGFKRLLEIKAEYLAALASAVANEQERARAMANLAKAVTCLKAHFRGYKARVYVREYRVKKLFAIMVLQRCMRRTFAYRETRKMRRHHFIREMKLQQEELILMREEDADAGFINYKLRAILTIQRCYRGYKGRFVAFIEKFALVRHINFTYYRDQEKVRENVDAQKRSKVAMENLRNKSAIEIQKIARGRIARAYFKVVKMNVKREKMCVLIQREYRRHLAELKLQAITRDKAAQLKFFRVRKQRGLVLRMFGLFNRKTQAMVSGALQVMGIDPKSFNYRPRELYQEFLQDYQLIKDLWRREKGLYDDHQFNKLEKIKGRRKKVIEAGWGLKVYDSVRIIEEDHPFFGLTGIIVRIDQSIAGMPLYDIKLDRFNRQTFVRMTTDALVFYDTDRGNHLSKIAKKPLLRDELVQPYVVFGTDPTNPFCGRTNVIAAWKIQKCFRRYRARKVANRMRYEFWQRAVDNQKTLYQQLSDTNTLTRHAYNITGLLGMRVRRAIRFDEMNFPFFPGRYAMASKKMNEKANIRKELDLKVRQRQYFMETAGAVKGRKFFSVGATRMAGAQQVSLMFSMLFGMSSGGRLRLSDMQGARGARMIAKQKTRVTGMDFYDFKQFNGSPHVRYTNAFLYQGEWTGIPMFTPLKPQGEGMIIFFDGWGYAREDKVLYITIIRCTGLVAADISTSDPYVDISCNGTNVQSSIKWQDLNPVYFESFEIDVTNPAAVVTIKVMDKDFFGSDEFLGQIQFRVGKYIDGKVHHEKLELIGEDPTVTDPFDLGEIEFTVRWSERLFEDDVKAIENRAHAATIMQAFFRRMGAVFRVKRLKRENAQLMKMVRIKAVKITSVCRMRMAIKELKGLRRRWKAAIRIQKRIRIFIAKRTVGLRRLQKAKAIMIQRAARCYIARMTLNKLRKQRQSMLRRNATTIQKWGRRMLAQNRVTRIRAERGLGTKIDASSIASQTSIDSDDESLSSLQRKKKKKPKKSLIAAWIGTYGVDPEYGLRRNRRMTEAAFKRMLKLRYARLITKPFGIVYVDHYPSKLSDEEAARQQQQGTEPLTVRDDFVTVFVPSFHASAFTRADAVKMIEARPFGAQIHLSTSVLMRKSVDFTATVIQCAARKRRARKQLKEILRIHAAIAKLQRKFRRRNEIFHRAAFRLTALFHRIVAKKRVSIRRRERRAAIMIQCGFRCYRARCYIFDCQSVKGTTVLRCSSFMPRYPPEKCLDMREDTFWMSASPKEAEIRVELFRKEQIESIWIHAATYEASPNFVTISYVADKASKQYERLYNKVFLRQQKGLQWFKFYFPRPVETKYFKLLFEDNYSDESSIGVRQIRFQRCRETSPIIEEQPKEYILDPGPMLGTYLDITLRCRARAWPYPTFQWYKNGKLIPGAVGQELRLRLSSTLDTEVRTYRCKKCAMVSRKVPVNAYHVRCRNCSVVFAYNEAFEYDQFVEKLKEEESVLLEEKGKLSQLLQRLKAYHDAKHDLLLEEATRKFGEVELKLTRLREARYFDKYDIEQSNRFTDEGVYCCYVKNLRGGSMPMITKSRRVVVAVQHPEPYLLDVRPQFNPRPLAMRKKWTAYSSIVGTFSKGRLCGIVTIRYSDSSFYEGPYIGEEWLDQMGNLNKVGKAPNHYGVFTLPNGKVFEGKNVDNHFDPFNLQQNYKLTLPSGEIYDGQFSDEEFHGIGIFYFKDGSVYEGEWHRGMQFGHGQLRSSKGWTYEGFFDSNRRHGQGAIHWPDGSFYIGQWYFEQITGRGLYVSRLRDVYRGDFVNSVFHGYGELLYTSGARYSGAFSQGRRHGKGVYTDLTGNEFYGIFVDDELDGEVVVKSIIKIEERGQDNFEVKVGLYERGKLLHWKVKFSHPIATKEFIKLFDNNSAMYDSVYSMMLAKNLPDVPDGVDMNNKDVRRIVTRIRDEAGDLVSEHALQAARDRILTFQTPIDNLRAELASLKTSIEQNEAKALSMEQEASMLMNKFSVIIDVAEREAKKAEQYWVDDPREIRGKHNEAVKALSKVSKEDFFDFKSHRFPPPFVKKILDAISCLLNTSKDWKAQQLLMSDSLFNAREGDEQALRFRYDCKLVHMLKDYDVYNYCGVDHGQYGGDLGKILSDPRFRRDSYYVESCGDAAPFLVDWIKINYQYVQAAKNNLGILRASEEKKIEAFRIKAISVKKRDDLGPQLAQIEADKKRCLQIEEELSELDIALAKANNMLLFLQETFEVSRSKERKLDYYERMEQSMEAKRDFLQIETALRVCVDGVEARIQDEKQLKMKLAAARGQVYVEEVVTRPQLIDWINTEIADQQQKIISEGRTLGYSYETEPNALNEDETQVYINLVVDLVLLRMNERFNDLATATSWSNHKGHHFNARFLYVSTWKLWKAQALKVEDDKAIAAWESVFGTPAQCAIMAVEARINERMSKLAREQGRVWAARYPEEIEQAEATLAYHFHEMYPENTARMTLEVCEDTSGAIPPSTMAACLCWMKLHPQAISEVKDEIGKQLAEDFAAQFKMETAVDAFRIVNNIATDAEMIWRDQAVEWRTYNETAYNEAAEQQVSQMAKEFRENIPKSANETTECAKILLHHAFSELIPDEEVRKEWEKPKLVVFNANCYQIRNQGLVRAATAQLLSEHATDAHRMWAELETSTDNFRKGSYIFVPQDARENTSMDRFYGFRARVLKKYAWLYAYLSYRQIQLVKDVSSFESKDPYGKAFHNIRPSEHKRVMRDKDEEFKKFKMEVEKGLREIFSKLSVWNTYFGFSAQFSEQSDEMRAVWGVAKDLILDIKKSEGMPPPALLSSTFSHFTK